MNTNREADIQEAERHHMDYKQYSILKNRIYHQYKQPEKARHELIKALMLHDDLFEHCPSLFK